MLTATLTELTAARATLLDACAEIAGSGVTGNRNNRFLELARGIAELVTNGALDRAEAAGNLRAAVDSSRAMPYDPKLVRQALAAWFSAPVVQQDPAYIKFKDDAGWEKLTQGHPWQSLVPPGAGMVIPPNYMRDGVHWLRHTDGRVGTCTWVGDGWRWESFTARMTPCQMHQAGWHYEAPFDAKVLPQVYAPPVSLPYHYLLTEIRRDSEDGYGYHQMRTTATLRQMRPIGTTLGPLDEVVITGGKEVGALFPNYDAEAKYEITIRRVSP
jgi:hypothetical protein